VLENDFNLRHPEWPGLTSVGGHDVDHIFIAGAVKACTGPEVLERGTLSDHAPVAVDLRLTVGEAAAGPDV
jgi:endonuclease/exonuclease/phosphatase family metal-dependent hydrolase